MGEIDTAEVGYVVDQARVLLAGRPPEVQGTVLADLVATYLAGHISLDDPAETDALREDVLAALVDLVRKLIPINDALIHGPTRN